MKFGKELARQRDERFRDYYINYKDLKRAIKALRPPAEAKAEAKAGARSQTGAGSDVQFGERLTHELERINSFVSLQYEVINGELKTRVRGADRDNAEQKAESLDKLAEEIVVLDRFVRLNYVAFRKITKKCDKQCGTHFSASFMPRAERAAFRQWDFDALLWQLGRLYAQWRRGQGAEVESEGQGGEHLETFFVAPEYVMRAKLLLARRLQLVVPATAAVPSMVADAAPKAGSTTRRKSALKVDLPSIVQPLTCVYLDGTRGSQYGERAHRFKNAEEWQTRDMAFRCRWVGKNDGDKDNIVNIDSQIEGGTMVEVQLKQQHVPSLLEGKVVPKEAIEDESWGQVLDSVSMLIRGQGLRPLVSTTFRRTAFADEGEKSTCTFDEDVAFHDELKGLDAAKKGEWCRALRDLSSAPATEGRVAMPQAVLRIHVAGSGVAAALRKEMEAFFVPQTVPGFSKAVLGTFLLQSELAVPPPPWVPEIEPARPAAATEIPKGVQKAVVAPAKPAKPAPAAPKEPPKEPSGCCALVKRAFDKKSGGQPLHVDIKTPLANERTLLRWLRSAVMLTSVSAFLSSRQDDASQINGLLLAGVAVLFIFWPTMIFRRRALEIAEVKEVQADRILPQALALSLVVVLSATLIVHLLFANPGDVRTSDDSEYRTSSDNPPY